MSQTKLRIHLWGEPILRKKVRRVDVVDDKVRKILDEMSLLMKISDGVGLAANQAGVNMRLIVVAAKQDVLKLVNPRIVKKEGTVSFEEGCLSFPGIHCTVKRAEKIWVSCLDEKGDECDLEAEGVLSVVLQHEIDHINGIVFVDRIPFLARLKLNKKLRDIKKTARHGLSKQK